MRDATPLGGDDREDRRIEARVRVLHTIETEDPGGAEQMILDLVETLGPEYDSVVGILKKGWLWSQVRSADMPWMMLEGGGVKDVRLVAHLVRLVRRERIDLIHAHEFYMNAVCAVVSRLTGVPLVATVHGKNYYPDRLRRRVIYRVAATRAAAVVAVSEDLRQFFCRVTKTSPGYVRVIHNGVDPDTWPAERNPDVQHSLGIPAGAAVVGTVGSLYPVKGHEYFIRAAPLILERRPDVHFILVGGGPLEGTLRALAEAQGVGERVHLVGHREDVRQLVGAMDVFVLPSRSEGFPIALLEAMAAGKPAVVSEVGGIPEVVRDQVTGLLVPPGDVEALADRVVTLLESPSTAGRIGECGQRLIRERFSLQVMVAAYTDVYRSALALRSMPTTDRTRMRRRTAPTRSSPRYEQTSRVRTGRAPSNGDGMPRVLVLDANQRSALATTRSLGRRGVPVIAADAVGRSLAGASRYCQETLVYPSPYSNPDGFISAVQAAVATRSVGVVLPMTEVTTELLLRHRSELGGATVPFGPLEAFERLNDKRRLVELAQALGVPTPRTISVDSPETLAAVADVLSFPVVLKPYRSRIPTGRGWVAGEVRYAHSAQELLAVARTEISFRAHPFLVQEYIAGQGQGVFALYDRGRAVTFFAHRRLRERPPSGGVSVVSESVSLDPDLHKTAQRILDHVGWHGVAMVEFKVTPEGSAYLMEVNPRFWGSLQLAVDAGVDFPWLLYQLADGRLECPTHEYRPGVRVRWLLGDLDHLYLRLRDERSVRARWRAVSAFLRPLGQTRHEVNRWGDWKPSMTEIRQYLVGLGRRGFRRR